MATVENGHAIKISVGAYLGGGTKVEIDGTEVKQLVDIRFEHRVDGIATLSLTLYPESVELVGDIKNLFVEKV